MTANPGSRAGRVLVLLSAVLLLSGLLNLLCAFFPRSANMAAPGPSGPSDPSDSSDGDAPSHRGFTSPFSFNLTPSPGRRSWMSAVPDDTPLARLSIPGTHDTMTYGVESHFLHCQNTPLEAQLRAGIRYVDIRVRLRGRELHVFHSVAYTGFSLDDVLRAVYRFLGENPRETALVRLRKEGPAADGDESVPFKRALDSAVARNRASWDEFTLAPERDGLAGRPWPTLGMMRRKALILYDNFDVEGDTAIGVPWDSDKMVLQDFFELPNPYSVLKKWALIQESLEKAANASDGISLHASHISATHALDPIVVAAGARDTRTCTLPGMNNVLGEYLEDKSLAAGDDGTPRRTGVVIMDFPGQRLVDAIIKRNGGSVLAAG